jgi:hypothetical protein
MSRFGQHYQPIPRIRYTTTDVCFLPQSFVQLYLSLLLLIMYSELDQLRTQTQTAQTESASAASQTAAMMSLNLKLQSSAMKNLARNIDLELKSLEARESKELLSIVQVCALLFCFGPSLILISL